MYINYTQTSQKLYLGKRAQGNVQRVYYGNCISVGDKYIQHTAPMANGNYVRVHSVKVMNRASAHTLEANQVGLVVKMRGKDADNMADDLEHKKLSEDQRTLQKMSENGVNSLSGGKGDLYYDIHVRNFIPAA
jgi:hypothetical protein